MASLNQALGDLVAMSLNSSKLWENKVRADEDIIFPASFRLITLLFSHVKIKLVA